MTRMRSPNFPGIPLEQAVKLVEAIYRNNRKNVIPRESAAKDLGYSGLTGRSVKLLGALNQYGLIANKAKGEMHVTEIAEQILHGIDEEDRYAALRSAGREPKLFQSIYERFPDGIPGDNAVRSFLFTSGFTDKGVDAALNSFLETNRFLELKEVSESYGNTPNHTPDFDSQNEGEENEPVFGGAQIGDLVQWEVSGVLQMDKPMRVRHVTDDGAWVAVEGSETGIPMEQVIVDERPAPPSKEAPRFPIEVNKPEGENSNLPEGWKEERLIDDGGEEIFIRYRGEPSGERYTYIRDYLDFKLSRLKKVG